MYADFETDVIKIRHKSYLGNISCTWNWGNMLGGEQKVIF